MPARSKQLAASKTSAKKTSSTLKRRSKSSRKDVDKLPKFFHRIPYDVQLVVFEKADEITRACLGLTCMDLYKHLKKRYPKPIRLRTITQARTLPKPPKSLGLLLKKWIGPNYRLSRKVDKGFDMFLHRRRYGYQYSIVTHAEKALARRYQKYREFHTIPGIWGVVWYKLHDREEVFLKGLTLLSPFGLGDSWNKRAEEKATTELLQHTEYIRVGGLREMYSALAFHSKWCKFFGHI